MGARDANRGCNDGVAGEDRGRGGWFAKSGDEAQIGPAGGLYAGDRAACPETARKRRALFDRRQRVGERLEHTGRLYRDRRRGVTCAWLHLL
jgi:hypothetical protein